MARDFSVTRDDKALIALEIGAAPDDLDEAAARKSATAWLLARRTYPSAAFHIMVGGFGEDPRELFQIPEVRAFVCQWAELVGIDTIDKALAINWLPSTRRDSVALLGNCGAFGQLSPDQVRFLNNALGPRPRSPWSL